MHGACWYYWRKVVGGRGPTATVCFQKTHKKHTKIDYNRTMVENPRDILLIDLPDKASDSDGGNSVGGEVDSSTEMVKKVMKQANQLEKK